MKRVYWRPRAVSRTALVLVGIVSLIALMLVETPITKVETERPFHEEKINAARTAQRAMNVVKDAREQVGPPIDNLVDPTESGLVGMAMSPITSVHGSLIAKKTSINPDFAAVIVDMLKDAGLAEGDVVAVGVSGSFPALNICTFAAVEELKLKPIVIASASASQWGANVPDLMWVDMERVLHDEGVFQTRSVAASIGGEEDLGIGMSPEGKQAVIEGITRNDLELIDSPTFLENVQKRLDIYREEAGGKPIKCYINIGGGSVSVGRKAGKFMFRPGLNVRPPLRVGEVEGVMPSLTQQGIPVIHLSQIIELAERYGMPVEPYSFPEIGTANVFTSRDYNKSLVVGSLAVILGCLYGFIRSDIGYRLLSPTGKKKTEGHPEPMV